MRLTLLLMLLLCSCATQRQAEKYFNEHPDELAKYVDKNKSYTRQYGATYAVRHFPPRFYPPAIHVPTAITADRLVPSLMLQRERVVTTSPGFSVLPEAKRTYITKTVYLEDTMQLEELRTKLKKERDEHSVVKNLLKNTEAERDYWREMNRKKLWALIAMAVFALLYILFKVLAARVRESE